MTAPRSKSETISETTKTHLVDLWASFKYHRREDISSKYLSKGNEREEDSITLLNRYLFQLGKRVVLNKNTERLTIDFITGEPDVFIGDSIKNAEAIYDTKTSWSLHTFLRSSIAELSSQYYWQMQGYMWLTNSPVAYVSFCLVNGTEKSIANEKRIASYSVNSIDVENDEDFISKCKQIEINHIFDLPAFQNDYPHFDFHNNIEEWSFDIPFEKRIKLFEVKRNDNEIELLKHRIQDCRLWIFNNLIEK